MSKSLRIVRIIEGTSVDGPGLRTSVYVAGCEHHCPGCHNKSTWDFGVGEEMSPEEVMDIIRYNGFNVTFSGGDPFYSSESLLELARMIKGEGYSLWIYTGFIYEDLHEKGTPGQKALLEYADVVVDGPFVESLKDVSLIFRGSSNQRLIDVAKSKKNGVATLYDLDV